MRNSVVVDGVTLTRAQVEKAMQALNAPEPLPLLKPGQWVRTRTGVLRVVVNQSVAKDYMSREALVDNPNRLIVFNPEWGEVTHDSRDFYTPVSTPAGIE